MHTIQNDKDHVSEKIKSCFFPSIRYRKRYQTQEVKSQSTKRSVGKIALPKRDSAFEQETRFVSNWRSEEVVRTAFLVTTKATSPLELKKKFLERTEPRFGKFLFCSRNKSCFYKYSKSQDIADARSKKRKYQPKLRKLMQPKCDSAFEQKTRIVSSREIWGSFQNRCCSYNQRIKPSRAQKYIFGPYSTSFRKSSVLFKKQKLFFISIRFHKTSQTQVVKSQSTECSVRKIAQPKLDSAFEQKTRIVPNRETSVSSQNMFLSYNQRKKQSIAETDFFGTYSTSFWKVGVFLSVKSPKTFRKVCTKIIKTIAHNTKWRRPRFRKKQKLFL